MDETPDPGGLSSGSIATLLENIKCTVENLNQDVKECKKDIKDVKERLQNKENLDHSRLSIMGRSRYTKV